MTLKFPIPLTVTFSSVINYYRHLFTSLIPNRRTAQYIVGRVIRALIPRNYYLEFEVRIGLINNELILILFKLNRGGSVFILFRGFMLQNDLNH